MQPLDEKAVSLRLKNYISKCGLCPIGKHSPFLHTDDSLERSFEIDLAVEPISKLGERSQDDVDHDRVKFSDAADAIDRVVEDLLEHTLFPGQELSRMSWTWEPNPNPVYGIAIEIENTMTKYFLGSLLAAAIAGRWGILIVPDDPAVPKWIKTIERMLHKGFPSPIPTNIAIFSWPTLEKYLVQSESGSGEDLPPRPHTTGHTGSSFALRAAADMR